MRGPLWVKKAKYSLGADVFRFTPVSGHPACGLGCLSCATSGLMQGSKQHLQSTIS